MKKLVAVLSLLVSSAVAEPPAPYAPSGWRPSGPSFELPQRGQQPQSQQPSQYLPPVDPRNPNTQQYPEEDVSVQGLPQPEPRPLFKVSPISGKQYTGPSFNKDLKSLDQGFQQTQYQRQQERYREYQRKQQLETQTPTNRLPNPSPPRSFVRTTTESPNTTQVTSTTGFDLNQEEVLNESEPTTLKEKTSVEVTKQKVQEYPGELFLSSLAQLQLQPQFIPLQTSGLSGAYVQGKQVAGFDGPAHFSALPSILAQQKDRGLLLQNEQVLVQQPLSQFAQAQVTQYQPQPQVQTQYQPDPVVLQAPAQFQPNVFIQPNPDAVAVQPNYAPASSYQPVIQPQTQFQVQQAFQPQPGYQTQQPQPGYQTQQPQPGFAQSNVQQSENEEDNKNKNQDSQQFNQQPIIVQPQFPAQLNQDQFYQGLEQPQTQYLQPAQPQQFVPLQQFTQPRQFAQPQPQQGQLAQPQTQFLQPQPAESPNQYAQPQGQFAQPQNQFTQPQYQFLQPLSAEPQNQYAQLQPQVLQPQPDEPQNQYAQPQQGQFGQPQNKFAQTQNQFAQPQNQYVPQPAQGFVQPQFQPQSAEPQNQYGQQQFLQPQTADPQNFQPQVQYQPTQYQAQLVQIAPQNQYPQPQDQRQFADQTQLQSGLDGQNQERNDIDEPEDTKEDGATAVATAFGTRTQPRGYTRYGAPFPVPKVQANPGYSTTESAVEDITEEEPAVAQAVAVADGERRKSARLRSRRIRPVYAVDRSGRLVLAEA